jgi:hypothetical protein
MLPDPLAQQIRIQSVFERHPGDRHARLQASLDKLALGLRIKAAPLAATPHTNDKALIQAAANIFCHSVHLLFKWTPSSPMLARDDRA